MRVQTNYHTRLDMKIKTNCLPKWSNATLITCLDKSHALREKLASSDSMSIQLHEMREVHFSLLLPLLLPWLHGKLIALFHFALIQTRITTLQIRHASNLFLFIILFLPLLLLLQVVKRFPYCCAQMWIVCYAMICVCGCVCVVCVCCAGFRLAYAFCLLSVHTVHNVRIKLFSHYPVHSGFIKKFTMRCRSRFVGQPRTHSRAHTKSHTLKLLAHTHTHTHIM